MYPMNVILIGCDEDLLPQLRCELTNGCAHVEAEFAAIEDASAVLRSCPGERRLFLVHVRTSEDLEALRQLCTMFTGWPILALMDSGPDPTALLNSMFLPAMRAGASQIVPLPLHPGDFRAALESIVTQFGFAAEDSNIIAVAGATGGCGATTIAINLAYEIAFQEKLHCILVDLSLKMSAVASYLSVEPQYTIHDLLRDVRRVDPIMVQSVLVKLAENLEVLAGSPQVTHVTPAPQDVARVIDTVHLMADVVVLDLPCTYDDLFFDIIAGAGQIVLVGEQKIPSIRALKLLRESLGREDVGRNELLVINRYNPKIAGFTADYLVKALEVPTLHTIAEDGRAVVAAVNRGCPLRLEAPKSRTLTDIDSLVHTLLARGIEPAPSKGPGLFGRLRRAFATP